VLSLDPNAKQQPFLATEAIESDPAISPDGRWIAYRSCPSANAPCEVYVVRFPEATGKVQITSSGGGTPFWSRDGRELFFAAPPGVLQVAAVTVGHRLQVGSTRTLFPLGDLNIASVSADGTRFLVARIPRTDPPTEIVVVQNWLQKLAKLVPPK